MTRPYSLRQAIRDTLVALAFLLVWLNLHTVAVAFETAPGSSAWYPARGVSLALLLVFGLRFAPVVVLASLIGGVAYHLPHSPLTWLGVSTLIGGAMTVCAWALGHLGFQRELRLRDAVALIVVAALAEVAVAYGVVGLNVVSGTVPPADYWGVAFQFFVGDFIGILIVVPLAVLLAAAGPPGRWVRAWRLLAPGVRRQRGLEALLIAALAAMLLGLGLAEANDSFTATRRGRWYLLMLPLALAAIRFGPLGAAITTAVLSVGVVAVVRAGGNPMHQVDLQLLLLSLSAVSLLLSAAVADRRRTMQALADAHHAEAVRAQREADQARRSMARFMAATTHDVRPPYEAVRLGIETLSMHELPAPARELLQHTQSALRSLGRVLDSVLDTARLEGELRGSRPRPVSLRPLLEEALRHAAGLREGAAPLMRLRCADWTVITDPVLIERLLGNLLANATRAAGPGGRVLVGVRRAGPMLRVQVHDNGGGIAAQRLETIFDDFVSHSEGGTGIGLSLVREIAQGLRLGLQVRSAPGAGTTFTFELPLGAASLPMSVALAEAVQSMRDRVCAVALNDHAAHETLCAVLSDWGAAVISAASSQALLHDSEALDHRPELFVSDEPPPPSWRTRGRARWVTLSHSTPRSMAASLAQVIATR